MESNPLVSVIVPVYNQEFFLKKCLESITKQTYSNLEILLIDDGSSDGSGKLCDSWAKRDDRIKVFHTENNGVSCARNIGLANLHGELVCFIDPDDWVEKCMINQMVKTMVEYKVDLTFIQYDEFSDHEIKKRDAQNSRTQLFTQKKIIEFILEEVKLTNHVWRGIYRRKLIRPNIFPKGKNYEDMYSMLEFVEPCRSFAIINTILYHHRLSKKAITSTWNISNCMDYCDASAHEADLALKLYPEFRTVVSYKVIKDILYVWNNSVRSNISGTDFQKVLKELNGLLNKYYTNGGQLFNVKVQLYTIRHIKIGNKICNRFIYGFLRIKKLLTRGKE